MWNKNNTLTHRWQLDGSISQKCDDCSGGRSVRLWCSGVAARRSLPILSLWTPTQSEGRLPPILWAGFTALYPISRTENVTAWVWLPLSALCRQVFRINDNAGPSYIPIARCTFDSINLNQYELLAAWIVQEGGQAGSETERLRSINKFESYCITNYLFGGFNMILVHCSCFIKSLLEISMFDARNFVDTVSFQPRL